MGICRLARQHMFALHCRHRAGKAVELSRRDGFARGSQVNGRFDHRRGAGRQFLVAGTLKIGVLANGFDLGGGGQARVQVAVLMRIALKRLRPVARGGREIDRLFRTHDAPGRIHAGSKLVVGVAGPGIHADLRRGWPRFRR